MDHIAIINNLIVNGDERYDYPIKFKLKLNKNKKFENGETKIEYIDQLVNTEVQYRIPLPVTIQYKGVYYNIRWVQDIEKADDIYDLYYNKKIKLYDVIIYGYLKTIINPIYCILLQSSSYKDLP
jgi:hypothetical protein